MEESIRKAHCLGLIHFGATVAQSLSAGHAGPHGVFYKEMQFLFNEHFMVSMADPNLLGELESFIREQRIPMPSFAWAPRLVLVGTAGLCFSYGYLFGSTGPGPAILAGALAAVSISRDQ